MQDPADPVSSLPPPPRPVLPRISRRAWSEPTVRFWWVLAFVLLALAPFVGAGPFRQWQKLSRLSTEPAVNAKVLRTDRETVTGRPTLAGAQVQIEIAAPSPRQLWGTLDGWTKGPLPRIGDTIEIRLDPDDPDAWAVVHQVPPMISALATGLSIAAIAVLPLLAAFVLRARVLKVWRHGQLREAAVVGQQQTALAPGAYALRCVWIDGDGPTTSAARGKARPDRSIFRVFVPKRTQPALDRDAVVHVLALPDGGKRLALDWFNA
ncbi:hypothetical protein [Humisphaera borealis]|uniref:DUF3592 domain-containing protein n=1 Tax=Humisphaera borealis TaxID=2807512 RepID=A0A7M2X1Z9_9BACT|nr:hypothetical protein [Humisphaera borealis]QOV91786.1 hypothetical protein IPV69_10695 [Humisphaera borealis]